MSTSYVDSSPTYRGTDTPQSYPGFGNVFVGYLWMDMAGPTLKKCTSISPITWASVEGGAGGSPGGTSGQVQWNNAGSFGGIAEGASGQVLISNGAGVSATFQDPIVSGPDAEGVAPTKNPVFVSGKGADGFIHSVRMANDGTVRVDPTGTTTQPISGTVTANIGTSGSLALDVSVTAVQPRRIQDGVGATLATVTAGNALKVDGSATTQPVSGTITANQGTASANDWRTDQRRGLTLSFASIDIAAAGDNTIVAADVTRKVKVLNYVIVADAAVTARWKSGAASNLSGAMSLAANGGVAIGGGSPGSNWLMETAVNQALVLNLSGAIGTRGHLGYFLEA